MILKVMKIGNGQMEHVSMKAVTLIGQAGTQITRMNLTTQPQIAVVSSTEKYPMESRHSPNHS